MTTPSAKPRALAQCPEPAPPQPSLPGTPQAWALTLATLHSLPSSNPFSNLRSRLPAHPLDSPESNSLLALTEGLAALSKRC